MAKFSGKNIEFKDGQKAVFGNNDDSSIYWDSDQLVITTVASGVDPILDGHLVTKRYLDQVVNVSGTVGTFLDLTDTPSNYTNYAGYVVTVNSVEGGLEFTMPGSYNVDGGFANSVYGGVPGMDGGDA
jgi:hypothetical protein